MAKLYYKWTDEERAYLGEITPGRHYNEIYELMEERFPDRFTDGQIRSAIRRYHFNTGFTGQFPKGNIPPNKGRKGYCPEGCKKTWYKKGSRPISYRPLGAERIDVDGYTLVKTGEPSTWEMKHKVIWEKAHGKVPEGSVVIFADGDKSNFKLDNLILVTRYQLLVLNRYGLIKDAAELTKLGIKIADIEIKLRELKKVKE